MQLVINNLTGSTRTYLSGAVSVPGSGSTTITLTTQQFQLATDGVLRSDIFANNASISDGTNPFGTQDAINYLYQVLQSLGPVSDASGNNITSTAVTAGSKQALDTTQQKVPLTPSSPTTATLGVTSGTAVAFNANRKGLTIINVSTSKVSLGLGVAAVLNSGITLYPGGSWVMDEYTYTTNSLSGIAGAASSVISIQEFTV